MLTHRLKTKGSGVGGKKHPGRGGGCETRATSIKRGKKEPQRRRRHCKEWKQKTFVVRSERPKKRGARMPSWWRKKIMMVCMRPAEKRQGKRGWGKKGS